MISYKRKNYDFTGRKLLDFLQYADGTNSLKQISKSIKLSMSKTLNIFRVLKKNKLLN